MTDAAAAWDFIVALYQRDGVAERCLDWQDRLGADVPLLLLLAWAGWRGYGVDQTGLQALVGAADPWRARVVVPLRGVRRRLKSIDGLVSASAAADLRRQVAGVELAAERLAFDHLVPILNRLARPVSGGSQAIDTNMARYLAALGGDPTCEQDSINCCVIAAQQG